MTRKPGRRRGGVYPTVFALSVSLAALADSRLGLAQNYLEALEGEVAALEQEKATLERALEEAESAARTAQTDLEKEIETLTARLARTRADNAVRSDRFPERERVLSAQNKSRRLQQLTSQMRAWLTTRGATVAENAEIDHLFASALDIISEKGALQVEAGEYFGLDGRAKTEAILRIGSVGAVAMGSPPIVLALVADGSLRAVPGLAARAPEISAPAALLEVVLFDPLDTSQDLSYATGGAFDWFRKGGPIMWPLALLGLIAGLLAFERLVVLILASIQVSRCERGGAVNAGVLAPLAVVQRSGSSLETLEERAADALRITRSKLRRGLFFVAVTAGAAPLIGLLGTVTGMIGTFSVITEHGTGDPRLLSSGISEALLTTQLGLTIAIPALLAHAILLRFAERVLVRIEALTVDRLARRKGAVSDG